MRKVLTLLFLLSLNGLLQAYEPEVGVLDSDNPYDLSESERSIIENRKLSLSNKRALRAQRLKIEELQETIEGLRSVVDSLSQKLGKTGERLNRINEESQKADESELEDLRKRVDELERRLDNSFKKIDRAIKKLTKLISSSDVADKKKVSTPKVKESKKLTNGELLKKATIAFRDKRYDEARKIFEELADKSYKPAESNYYLGEIAYYQKRYDEAIAYYKKSVGYYDKASYMPTLLLHTALSFRNLDDNENADLFFQTIIDSYPDSSQARIARKYL
jgi:TolA-binding protein